MVVESSFHSSLLMFSFSRCSGYFKTTILQSQPDYPSELNPSRIQYMLHVNP